MTAFLVFTALLFLVILLIVEPDIEVWGQAYLLLLRNTYTPVFVFVMGCTVTFAQYAYLTVSFHRFKNADGEPDTCCPPEAKPRLRLSFHRLAAIGLYAGGMALSVGLAFFFICDPGNGFSGSSCDGYEDHQSSRLFGRGAGSDGRE